jgi:subtilisin family serine protease
MSRRFRAIRPLAAAICLAAGWVLPAAAQLQHVPITEPLRLAGSIRPVKGAKAVYIVKLRAPGAASYRGNVSALGATKPSSGQSQRPDIQSAAVQGYARQLEQGHDRLLAAVGAAGSKMYSYRYSLNGFAAELTAAQASQLAQRDEVERIWADTDQQVNTNNSAIFLGLEDQTGGLRADLGLRGENVVVGVIDSGVAPNHPSLLDTEERIPSACRSHWAEASWLGVWLCGSYRRNPPTELVYEPPIGFSGACQAGDGFPPDACDNKVVGARYYLDGFLVRHALDPNEFRSPKDADGHGTHVATIVAGNAVDASLLGTRVARISGIAPRARVAIYKACWLKPGDTRATCATSDLTRAIDDAVADGVDLINYSVGSLETDLTAPDDLAILNAFDAGVLTVVAAGNDGPSLDTVGSPSSAPWVLTTAASTQSGEFFDTAIEITAPSDLAEAVAMREASFTPALEEDAIEAPLVTAADGQGAISGGATGSTRDACQPLTNAADIDGNIALIERGGCEFEVKIANAEDAGAIAVVVYNNDGPPLAMNGDAGSVGIPAVMIGSADGQVLVDRIAADAEDDDEESAEETVTAKLARGIFVALSADGNVVADFSSRGPSLSDANFVKPDVTAPGVDILAGHTPAVANGLRGENYQYLSGTSQAAPEVAGVAALLKEAHPEWSPATLKSALMTSSYPGVLREDGEPADAFDMGAGHIDANRAVAPGLVYDNDFRDHAAYLCGLHDRPFPDADCNALEAAGYPSAATDLNLPSIGIAKFISGDTIRRRVTNVGPPASFSVEVTPPPNVDLYVEPPTLSLGTGQTAEYTVRFVDQGTDLDAWNFGELAWFNETQRVVSPIAVQAVTLRAPEEVFLSGRQGTTTIPMAFGYDGAYAASVHGLRKPFLDANGQVPRGFVDDDTSNSFSFRFDNGVSAHAITVPANQLYLRIALFDEFTDGNDDLDLFLFYCPNNQCTQIAESGGFTADEEIDVVLPDEGSYLVLVHGFETDQVAGGPGANYSLFTWSFGMDDDVGNLGVTAPANVTSGDRLSFDVQWSGLDAATRYLGAVGHTTPSGLYALTLVNVETP